MLEDLEDKENEGNFGHEDALLKENISREKAELKDLQAILEDDKRRYKEDKARVDELRLTDPSLYRQRIQVMERVKESIEKRIDDVNGRVKRLKEAEKKVNPK